MSRAIKFRAWLKDEDDEYKNTGLKDKNGIEIYEGDIFKAYWKETGKEYKAGYWGFIKAADKEDARHIMQQNLQDGYEVEQITDAYEHQITTQAICVNFPNTAEPLGFG